MRRYNSNNKYKARKTMVDGIVFDSMKEAQRYVVLKSFQKDGLIRNLELQKKFVLIEKQVGANGKVLERECAYKADFCYTDKNGNFVVEDAKGVRTTEYRIKRKLMLERYGIVIKEV